jgi:hypothetical protein
MPNKLVFWAIVAATAALSATARAEVKKYMNMCDGKLCPSYELVATPPQGWELEKKATKQNKVQMFVPRGKTFGDADALIYVKVSYKEKDLELAQFIATSQERWRQAVPKTKITKMPPVERANGKAAFQPYQYENPGHPGQPFEYVAFGEDSDNDGNTFTLMITATGGDQKAIEKIDAVYQAFLRAH